ASPPRAGASPPARRIAVSPGAAAVAVGLGLTAGLVPLHLSAVGHAGALWRDEVNSVNVALLPSWAAVWRGSAYDSFPVAWDALLHAWIVAGLGADDPGLRRLGLAIGLGTLAVLWLTGRRLGVRA